MIAILTLLGAPGAHAQERVWPPPTRPPPYLPESYLFPIVLVGEPEGLRVTLSTEDGAKPFLYCTARCGGWAYPGTYWVAVRSTRTTAAGGKEIRLKRASEIRVQARKRDETSVATTVGLAVSGAGIGLVALGAATEKHEEDAAVSGSAVMIEVGLLTIVAGGVLLLVGGSRDTTVPDVTISQ